MSLFSSLARWRASSSALDDGERAADESSSKDESTSSSDSSQSSESWSLVSSRSDSLPVPSSFSVSALRCDCPDIDRNESVTMENLPDRESRRNLRSSADCFRISRSRVLLMASRDELLISRSSTFRSRLAFAASSFIFWSFSVGGWGQDPDLVGLWRGDACATVCPVSNVSDDGIVSVDTMLVELDVDSSGEVGDVIDGARCCRGKPFRLTSPMGFLMGVSSGTLGLMTGDI
jgi:hypothetical protein